MALDVDKPSEAAPIEAPLIEASQSEATKVKTAQTDLALSLGFGATDSAIAKPYIDYITHKHISSDGTLHEYLSRFGETVKYFRDDTNSGTTIQDYIDNTYRATIGEREIGTTKLYTDQVMRILGIWLMSFDYFKKTVRGFRRVEWAYYLTVAKRKEQHRGNANPAEIHESRPEEGASRPAENNQAGEKYDAHGGGQQNDDSESQERAEIHESRPEEGARERYDAYSGGQQNDDSEPQERANGASATQINSKPRVTGGTGFRKGGQQDHNASLRERADSGSGNRSNLDPGALGIPSIREGAGLYDAARNTTLRDLVQKSGLFSSPVLMDETFLTESLPYSNETVNSYSPLHDLESTDIAATRLNAYTLYSLADTRCFWTTNLARHLLLIQKDGQWHLEIFSLPCVLECSDCLVKAGLPESLAGEIKASYPRLFSPFGLNSWHGRWGRLIGISHWCWCPSCSSRRLRNRELAPRNRPRADFDPSLQGLMEWDTSEHLLSWSHDDFEILWPRIMELERHLQGARPWQFWVLFRDRRDTLQFWTFFFATFLVIVTILLVILGAAQLAVTVKPPHR